MARMAQLHVFVFFLSNFFAMVLCTSYCKEPEKKDMVVEVGDDITLETIVQVINISTGGLLWTSEDGDIIGVCSDMQDNRSRREIGIQMQCQASGIPRNKYDFKTPICRKGECIFEFVIQDTSHEDTGTYTLKALNTSPSCIYFSANVTVQETNPICEVTRGKKSRSIRFSCTWVPLFREKVKIIRKQSETLHKLIHRAKTEKTENKSTSTLSTMVSLEAFSAHNLPDVCELTQFGVTKHCNFSPFLYPSEEHMYVSETKYALFKCYTPRGDAHSPRIWIYDKKSHTSNAVNMEDPSIVTVVELSRETGSNHDMMVLCGRETPRQLVIYGIGKLSINLPNYSKILLSVEITSMTSYILNSTEYINNAHLINDYKLVPEFRQLGENTTKEYETIPHLNSPEGVEISLDCFSSGTRVKLLCSPQAHL